MISDAAIPKTPCPSPNNTCNTLFSSLRKDKYVSVRKLPEPHAGSRNFK